MDYANINFWFQVGYAIGFVLQGRLIDRVGVKRVFFCAVLLWSLATGAHGLATSAVGFMVCRFILGLTEAANYPACVKNHPLVVPRRRARRGHRHLQRRDQRRCDVHADAAAVDPPRMGLASRVPVHGGTGRHLVAVLGPEVLQPGRSPERQTIGTGLHPEGSRAGTIPRTVLANPAHAWHLGLRPRLLDHRAGVFGSTCTGCRRFSISNTTWEST